MTVSSDWDGWNVRKVVARLMDSWNRFLADFCGYTPQYVALKKELRGLQLSDDSLPLQPLRLPPVFKWAP